MVSTDPVADMFSRIRNAIAVNKSQVSMPHSKIKQTVAQILVDNGFLTGLKVSDSGINKKLEITINPEGTNAVITEISRISRPGQRVYSNSSDIPLVKRGRGIVVVSTSHGLMTGKQAREQHLGGELICKVY